MVYKSYFGICNVVIRQEDAHTSFTFYVMSFINRTILSILVQSMLYFYLVSEYFHICAVILVHHLVVSQILAIIEHNCYYDNQYTTVSFGT